MTSSILILHYEGSVTPYWMTSLVSGTRGGCLGGGESDEDVQGEERGNGRGERARGADLFVFQILLLLAFVVCAVVAHSDEFGRNPQHDFGSVTGRVTNPVLPFWTMLGTLFQFYLILSSIHFIIRGCFCK